MAKLEYDRVGLAKSNDCAAMLKQHGDPEESIEYTEKVVKINRKGKKQDRVLLVTNRAIYNLKPKKYREPMRKIMLTDIGMLTLSDASPEFVVHVPSEYDYHLASKNQKVIADVLARLYHQCTNGGELLIVNSEMKHLKDLVLTQKLAKYENKEDKSGAQKKMVDASKEAFVDQPYPDDDDDD